MGIVALRAELLLKRLVHVQRPGGTSLEDTPDIEMAAGAGSRGHGADICAVLHVVAETAVIALRH